MAITTRTPYWRRGSTVVACGRRGRYNEALSVLDASLTANSLRQGIETAWTFGTVQQLSNIRNSLGEFELAERLQREVVDGRTRTLVERSQYEWHALCGLARLRAEAGHHEGALRLGQPALAVILRTYDRGNLETIPPETIPALVTMARVLHLAGRSEDASQVIDRALRYYNSHAAPHNELRRRRRLECARFFTTSAGLRKPRHSEELLDSCIRLLGEKELDSVYARRDLALTLLELGEHDRAKMLHQAGRCQLPPKLRRGPLANDVRDDGLALRSTDVVSTRKHWHLPRAPRVGFAVSTAKVIAGPCGSTKSESFVKMVIALRTAVLTSRKVEVLSFGL